MSRLRVLVQVIFFLACLFYVPPGLAAGILISNVNVLDVEHEKILPHQDVVIWGGVIQGIYPSLRSHSAGKNLNFIDGTGMYATPGLIDNHVHTDLYYWEKQADDWSLPLYIANGVTTVRDAAGSSLTLKMREEVEKGSRVGPRMVVTSPFITSDPNAVSSNVLLLTTAADTSAKISEFLGKGYDAVKVDSGLNLEAYHAAAALLQSKGSYLYGHSLYSNSKGYWEILTEEVAAHYRSIEHIGFLGDYLQLDTSPYFHKSTIRPGSLDWYSPAYMDFTKVPSLVQLLRKSKAAVSPTLVTIDYQLRLDTDKAAFLAAGLDGFHSNPVSQYYPDSYYKVWVSQYNSWGLGLASPRRAEIVSGLANEKKLIKLLDDAAIPIIAGTDTPARPFIVAGFSLHDELAEYSSSGMSNWRVLRTATVNSSRALGLKGKVGEMIPGASADIILSSTNPITDLSVLRKPDSMIVRGKAYSRKDLDSLLDGVKTFVHSPASQSAASRLIHLDLPIHAHSEVPQSKD